jgi:hypothetical protein
MPGLGVQRLQPPIVQDQELNIAERAADAGVPAITPRAIAKSPNSLGTR